jgi:hypothetical protein
MSDGQSVRTAAPAVVGYDSDPGNLRAANRSCIRQPGDSGMKSAKSSGDPHASRSTRCPRWGSRTMTAGALRSGSERIPLVQGMDPGGGDAFYGDRPTGVISVAHRVAGM